MAGEHEPDPWLTYQQAAQRVGLHVNTIRRAVRRGELQVARRSHTIVRLRQSWVDAWLQSVGRSVVGC